MEVICWTMVFCCFNIDNKSNINSVTKIDLNVMSMSVMRFQTNVIGGGWMGELY